MLKMKKSKKNFRKCTLTMKDIEGKPAVCVQQGNAEKHFTPEALCGKVLQLMRETAEAYLGHKVNFAVIAVPTYFNVAQREAVVEAADQAGLKVLRFIHEPTAAALAYQMDIPAPAPRVVLIFDFGGCTLDISVLRVEGGMVEILATARDSHLGGDDIDDRLVDHFVREFQRKHKSNLRDSGRSMLLLRASCERAKRVLSTSMQTVLEADSLYEGIDFFANLTRGRFDELISDVLKRIGPVLDTALRDAAVDKAGVAEVVLAGGSAKVPRVKALLGAYFGDVPLRDSIGPEEVVAIGAAAQAAVVAGSRASTLHATLSHRVTPLTIGVEVADGTLAPVIPRTTPVPHTTTIATSTAVDNQSAVSLQVYEGERLRARDNTLLGTVALHGLPAGPAGTPQVAVEFQLDEAGALRVTLTHAPTGATATLTVPSGPQRISQGEVDACVLAGLEDRANRAEAEDASEAGDADASEPSPEEGGEGPGEDSDMD